MASHRTPSCFVLVALLALSCREPVREHALALATRGQTTAARLSDYYESLARDTVDVWELSAFRRGFLKLPAPATDTRPAFDAQYKALRARARLARRLSNVYESLTRLSKYDTGASIVSSLDDLQGELQKVGVSPIATGTRRDMLDRAIGEIATWKQSRDIRTGAKALQGIVEAIDELFRSERQLYENIQEDRADKYRQIAIELVKAKDVVSTALVNRVLASYDLSLPDVKQPFTDEQTIAGIVEVIDARSRTFAAKSQDETESIADALRALVDAHKELAHD